jgi:hypothetical protein
MAGLSMAGGQWVDRWPTVCRTGSQAGQTQLIIQCRGKPQQKAHLPYKGRQYFSHPAAQSTLPLKYHPPPPARPLARALAPTHLVCKLPHVPQPGTQRARSSKLCMSVVLSQCCNAQRRTQQCRALCRGVKICTAEHAAQFSPAMPAVQCLPACHT